MKYEPQLIISKNIERVWGGLAVVMRQKITSHSKCLGKMKCEVKVRVCCNEERRTIVVYLGVQYARDAPGHTHSLCMIRNSTFRVDLKLPLQYTHRNLYFSVDVSAARTLVAHLF